MLNFSMTLARKVVSAASTALVGAAILLSIAPTAAAQITVHAGQTVTWDVTPPEGDFPGGVDGPHTSSPYGSLPTKGTAAIGWTSGSYTAGLNSSGYDEVRWAFRCNVYGSPYICSHGQRSFNIIPRAPVAENKSLSVAYNSSSSVMLSSSAGPAESYAVASAPQYGSVSIVGNTATYTANASAHSIQDTFTYTAQNAGGTSAPATVTVNIGAAPAPSGANFSLTMEQDTSRTFAPTVNGVATGLLKVSQDANVSFSFDGLSVLIVPAPGWTGTEVLTFRITGPGGTSAQSYTGTVTVVPPPTPTISGGTLSLAFNQSGSHDFTPSRAGTFAVVAQPASGSVTVSGAGVATYTPNQDFIGSDSFSVTATNAGGTSAPATVSVTVAPPPVPTISGGSLALPFNSSGLHDFAPTQGGALALASAPAHGSVSISGGVATYTPDQDYIGSDSFSVTATNLGGTSAPATVNVSVAPPPVPTITGGALALAFNSGGSHDFAPTQGGALALASAPAHGSVSISGGVATYTPDQDYIGSDSFSVTATNLGGTSAPATVNVSVAPPPVPTITGGALALAFNSSGSHDFAPTQGGALGLASAPAHGSVSISGGVATYMPDQDYIGSDSFSVTATNLGGTSAPASVNVSVAPPPIPTVTGASLSTGFNQPVSYTFAPTHGGSVSVSRAPQHGAVTLTGNMATFTPSEDFIGADEFGVVAENLGGQSAEAVIQVTVSPPAAPSAGALRVSTPYITPVLIDPDVSGVFSTIAIVAAPPSGAAEVVGERIRFTPAAGVVGEVAFTYQASGFGGTSGPATITVEVIPPPAPTLAGGVLNVDHGGAGELQLAPSGVVTELVIAGAPTNGTATLSGSALRYQARTGYSGADLVRVQARGPGGQSAIVDVTVTVAAAPETPPPPPPPPPVEPTTPEPVAAALSAEVQWNASAVFPVGTTGRGGPFVSVELTRTPAFGEATVAGLEVIYTPPAGQVGDVEMEYRLWTESTASEPAILSVKVVAPPAPAPTKEVVIEQGQVAEVDITAGAEGGPFSGARVVSLSPGRAGRATIVEQSARQMLRSEGAVGPAGSSSKGGADFALAFEPAAAFNGEAVIRYSLSNRFGGQTEGEVRILVRNLPDPAKDRDVSGLIAAQTQAGARFGNAQIGNVTRRMESIRDQDRTKASFGVSVSGVRSGAQSGPAPFASMSEVERTRADLEARREPSQDAREGLSTANSAEVGTGGWTPWAAGLIEIGNAGKERPDLEFATSGLSLGADRRLGKGTALGIGVGYGADRTEVGEAGSKLNATASSVFGYASQRLGEGGFIDGMVGISHLSMRTLRVVAETGEVASSDRDGRATYGSLAAGYSFKGERGQLVPYGRFDLLEVKLLQARERGTEHHDLQYLEQTASEQWLTVGLRGDYAFKVAGALITPSMRAEYRRSLRGVGAAPVRYAAWDESPVYQVPALASESEQLRFGLGLAVRLLSGWAWSVETDFLSQGGNLESTSLRLNGSGRF